jgi:hypothetical protein
MIRSTLSPDVSRRRFAPSIRTSCRYCVGEQPIAVKAPVQRTGADTEMAREIFH